MKRSDMIDNLEQYIRARFNPKSNPAEEAQMLLKRLENFGMLPPIKNKDFVSSIVSYICSVVKSFFNKCWLE